MVGHVVVQIQERQQRAQEALSLPGRQAKHQAQGDRRLDGVVRALALSAWLPARRPRRVPVGELAIGESEPDGRTSDSRERGEVGTRLVLPPIPDTVGLLDVLPLRVRLKLVMRDLGSRGGGQLLTEIASCAPRHQKAPDVARSGLGAQPSKCVTLSMRPRDALNRRH